MSAPAKCSHCGEPLVIVVNIDDSHLRNEVRLLRQRVEQIYKQGVKIMGAQEDVDTAVAEENAEIADIATKDAAIEAAQAQLLAAIQALPAGVDTSALVTATAALAAASGADDATVAALTAAANAATPAAE